MAVNLTLPVMVTSPESAETVNMFVLYESSDPLSLNKESPIEFLPVTFAIAF